ncbi:uncharacterized protein LOC106178514 [Lingula anatina]|uniref:Uncharacterized protein LOC106178514 n=1 Tax=Lingula anatina TaxID=7574 RepID=A0A1S3K4K4_LINAN|nr:uncharacterized protein LOC106178514 [Lingula anatina]XP_013417181.1 uncharacterized protein LOC106178514 [Lingula anatina]|eukprot:XP_013417180.1 uncharacterized protein LOC106178514 [Lingula anatina]
MGEPQRKRAMKRLLQDLEELKKSPVANVSAAPLDSDMFEWHCNFKLDDNVYHLILFFPENYPYRSPSAEFVPHGFQYHGGATKNGKKGTQVCLSIFSDFADWHREWANDKAMGWSPGYTVQTVLLNMLSFLIEVQSANSALGGTNEANLKRNQKFKCSDCGHNFKKPYPELPKESETTVSPPAAEDGKPHIVCYISKAPFKVVKPKCREELYGYGLIKSGPDHRPSLTTPCEFLTGDSFYSMQKSVGNVQSIMKEDLAFFLPLYIHPKHGEEIKATFEETMRAVSKILPGCKRDSTPMETIILRVIPNLMAATVVEFSKGTQHASDNHLSGYFALHRLFLWALKEYPKMQDMLEEKLKEFITDEDHRSKKACPHIGEWLMLLSASNKYTWQDASDAYLSESWRRNVMWYVKDDAKLGFMDTPQNYRLEKTLQATAVSRKILAFQVLFLDIAMPKSMTRDNVVKRYDENFGFPTTKMVAEMKAACSKIETMKSYEDWFKVLRLDPIPDDKLFEKLIESLEFAINTDGYHWSFWKGAGGWTEALKRYKATAGADSKKGKEVKHGKAQGAKKNDKDCASSTEDLKGKSKNSKKTVKEEGAKKPKGRATKRKVKDDDSDTDEEEEVQNAKGRGRGKRAATVPSPGKKPVAKKRP